MKPGWILLGTTAVLGGAALGTRVPQDTHTLTRRTVVVPDARVDALTTRLGALEARLDTLANRPTGLDGNEVRTLVETILPEPPPVVDETTTTTTTEPRE